MKAIVMAVLALLVIQQDEQFKTVPTSAQPKEQMQITFFGEGLEKIKIKQWVAITKIAGDFTQAVELPNGEVKAQEKQVPLVCQGLTPMIFRANGQVVLARYCPTIHFLEVEMGDNTFSFLVSGNYALIYTSAPISKVGIILEYHNWLTDQSKVGNLEVVVANNQVSNEKDLERVLKEVLNRTFDRVPRGRGAKKTLRHDQLAIIAPPQTQQGWCLIQVGDEKSKAIERVWEVREDKPFMVRFNLPLKEVPKGEDPLMIPPGVKGPIT